VTFIPDPDFIEELRSGDEYRAALAQEAAPVKAMAEANAQRIMRRNPQAFEIVVDEDGVSVVNTDYGGHIDEWGSIHNPPNASLRRAAQAAGLRLEEEPST
jgi:hypothetical protein